MLIICKEYPKRSRRNPAYHIAARNVTGEIIFKLGMRSRFNPELEYYITKLDETADDAHILAAAKQKGMLKPPYFEMI